MSNIKMIKKTATEIQTEHKEFMVGLFDFMVESKGVKFVIGADGYGYIQIRRQDGMWLSCNGWQSNEIYVADTKHNNRDKYYFSQPSYWYENKDGSEKVMNEDLHQVVLNDLYNMLVFFDSFDI